MECQAKCTAPFFWRRPVQTAGKTNGISTPGTEAEDIETRKLKDQHLVHQINIHTKCLFQSFSIHFSKCMILLALNNNDKSFNDEL